MEVAESLTESELDVFNLVADYMCSLRALPSLRVMADLLGYASHSTVQLYVDKLIDRGYLMRRENDGLIEIMLNRETTKHLRPLLSETMEGMSGAY